MRCGALSVAGRGSVSAIFLRLTPLSIPLSRTTMRKMSVLELLFALLLVCLLPVMAGVAFLVWNLVQRADGQTRDVAELKLRLEAAGPAQGPHPPDLRDPLP